MNKVVIYEADYSDCKKAIDRIFDAFPLEVKNKRVLVKPNGVRVSIPEQAINTHPAILRAVVDRLEEMGAGEIMVGENTGVRNYGETREAFRSSGLLEASKGYFQNIGAQAVPVPFHPHPIDPLYVSRAVLEADVLISLPKIKTTGLVGLSGAIKNSFGIPLGAQRSLFHLVANPAPHFARTLVDIYRIRVPDLIIADSILAMAGFGPYSPHLVWMGKVLGSDNGVALDATVARLVGYDPKDIPMLQYAQEQGLGEYEADAIRVMGRVQPFPGFQAPPVGPMHSLDPVSYEGMPIARAPHKRPVIDTRDCQGASCSLCIKACVTDALSMDGYPLLTAEKCVACFACQEVCPTRCIGLKVPPEMRAARA